MTKHSEQQRPKMYKVVLSTDLEQSHPIDPNDFTPQSPDSALISKKKHEEQFKILEKKGHFNLPGKSTTYDDKRFPSTSLNKYENIHFVDNNHQQEFLSELNTETNETGQFKKFSRIDINLAFELYIQDPLLADKANYTYTDILQFQNLIPKLQSAMANTNSNEMLEKLNRLEGEINNLNSLLETNNINDIYPELTTLRANCIDLLKTFISTHLMETGFTELNNIGKVNSFTGKYLYPQMKTAINEGLKKIAHEHSKEPIYQAPHQEKEDDSLSFKSVSSISQISGVEAQDNFSSSFQPLLNKINAYSLYLNKKSDALSQEKAEKLSSLSEKLKLLLEGGKNQTEDMAALKEQIHESKETLSQHRNTALKSLFWCCFSAFRPKTSSARLLEKLEENINKLDSNQAQINNNWMSNDTLNHRSR